MCKEAKNNNYEDRKWG